MSILLVDPPDGLGRALLRRLIPEGDDVAVVVEDAARGADLKALGAYIAVGSPEDADLIERAAQPARSIVIFDADVEAVRAAVEATAKLPDPARIILSARKPAPAIATILSASPGGFVTLRTGSIGRRLLRRTPTDEQLALAVDAADDLSGEIRSEIDLTTSEGWAALDLTAPWEIDPRL